MSQLHIFKKLIVIEVKLNALGSEQLFVLPHQRVYGLGENMNQVVFGQIVQGAKNRNTTSKLRDETELDDVGDLDLPQLGRQRFAVRFRLGNVLAEADDAFA